MVNPEQSTLLYAATGERGVLPAPRWPIMGRSGRGTKLCAQEVFHLAEVFRHSGRPKNDQA